jgi:hypothetical protein
MPNKWQDFVVAWNLKLPAKLGVREGSQAVIVAQHPPAVTACLHPWMPVHLSSGSTTPRVFALLPEWLKPRTVRVGGSLGWLCTEEMSTGNFLDSSSKP